MRLYPSSPRGHVVDAGFKRCRIAYHFVQHADNIRELWPCVPVFLPTVQHQLVQYYWTVHGSWQPEVLFYGIYHLGHGRRGENGTMTKEKTSGHKWLGKIIDLYLIPHCKADKIMCLQYAWKGPTWWQIHSELLLTAVSLNLTVFSATGVSPFREKTQKNTMYTTCPAQKQKVN